MYELNYQLEIVKKDLILHRLRILYNKPPTSYDPLQQLDLSLRCNSISNRPLRQQVLDRYKILIEKAKTDFILIRFMSMETVLDQYRTTLNIETNEMLRHHHHHNAIDKKMTSVLLHIIDQRTNLIKEKMKIISDFHINYYFRHHYGYIEDIRKGKIKDIQRIGFSSNLIIDSYMPSVSLTQQQLQLLNRGPTYVAPCQLHSLSSMSVFLTTHYLSLERQLKSLFQKYRIDSSQSIMIEKKIKDEFQSSFVTVNVSLDIRQRAFYERQLIQSIQQLLNINDLVLCRMADHTNRFYLTTKHHFEEKCLEFMSKHHDNYEILYSLTEHNQQQIRYELDNKIYRMNTKLEHLFRQSKISDRIYKKLYVKLDEIRLGYLYFLPQISSDHLDFNVKPMFSMYQSLTWKLADFLYELIRPVVIPLLQPTMINNESDFIQRLYRYCTLERRLRSTTFFARIKITNFYTMFSNQSVVNRVGYILTKHCSNNPIENLSIVTIEGLIELIFSNHLFYYQENIYSFIHGLPNSMRLSDLLLSICLYYWQTKIIDDHRLKSELFVRYKDDIFFTWNHSENDLHTFLHKIKETYDDEIHMNISYGRSIDYLNIYVENRIGQLYTRVYHPHGQSKLILPYVVGHPKMNHRHWFQSALIRAVQLCTLYEDFYRECLYLQMSCFVSGYSDKWTEYEFKKFYEYFNIETYRFHMNQTIYEQLRRRLLIHNDTQCDKSLQELDLKSNKYFLRFHYPYRYGYHRKFEEKFYEILSTFMKNHPQLSSNQRKLLLTAHHLFSLNTLLTQQKPVCELLKQPTEI
ncbi:unnamed protein product [Rotaria socialis]